MSTVMKKYELANEARRMLKSNLPGIEKLNMDQTDELYLATKKLFDAKAELEADIVALHEDAAGADI
jgi:hypothetical protein